MSRSTKEDWLQGPGDLRTTVVKDVPVEGKDVLVRGLPAAYSNQASSEALEMKTTAKGDQIATVATDKLEVLQFAHGCVEPTFSVHEARLIAQKYGPAFKRVIAEIDSLSGVDKEAIESATARFPSGGASENGSDVGDATPAGSGGPNVRSRAGD